MQSTSIDICNEFPDPDFMKSINDILFKELKTQTSKAEKLIIDLPPLGRFYYRKAKVKNFRDSENVFPETKEFCEKILKLYEEFDNDKLEKRYEQFGKENHEAYLLAKKEGRVQKFQKFEPEQHS